MRGRCLILGLLLTISLSLPSSAAPFSVRCERDGYYLLTFDDATGRFVSESPGRAGEWNRAYKGRISSVSDDEIRFVTLVQGGAPANMVFHRKQGTVDTLGGNEPQTVFVKCAATALRPILSQYDRIPPLE